jgi:hypothetical protein
MVVGLLLSYKKREDEKDDNKSDKPLANIYL